MSRQPTVRGTRRAVVFAWVAVIVSGGTVLVTLLEDALDGSALVVFTTTAEFPGPSWAIVSNAIIATACAAGLADYYHRKRR